MTPLMTFDIFNNLFPYFFLVLSFSIIISFLFSIFLCLDLYMQMSEKNSCSVKKCPHLSTSDRARMKTFFIVWQRIVVRFFTRVKFIYIVWKMALLVRTQKIRCFTMLQLIYTISTLTVAFRQFRRVVTTFNQ